MALIIRYKFSTPLGRFVYTSVGNELALPLHGRAANSISPFIFIRLFEILTMLNLFNANNLRPGRKSKE